MKMKELIRVLMMTDPEATVDFGEDADGTRIHIPCSRPGATYKFLIEEDDLGKTAELSNAAKYAVFYEQQHDFDRQDVEDAFCGYDDEDCVNDYGITVKEAEGMFDEMAYEMRRMIDKYDINSEYARDEAIRSVLNRQKTNR